MVAGKAPNTTYLPNVPFVGTHGEPDDFRQFQNLLFFRGTMVLLLCKKVSFKPVGTNLLLLLLETEDDLCGVVIRFGPK